MPAWRKLSTEKKKKGNCPPGFLNWDDFWRQYQGNNQHEFRSQWRCEACGLGCHGMITTAISHRYNDPTSDASFVYGFDQEAVIYCNPGGGQEYRPSRFVRVT